VRNKRGVVWMLGVAQVRIDTFPDHIARRRHLEEAAEPAFIDERVAVGQPLRVRNSRAEEVRRDGLLVNSGNVPGPGLAATGFLCASRINPACVMLCPIRGSAASGDEETVAKRYVLAKPHRASACSSSC
jgi:hypothetical protein